MVNRFTRTLFFFQSNYMTLFQDSIVLFNNIVLVLLRGIFGQYFCLYFCIFFYKREY